MYGYMDGYIGYRNGYMDEWVGLVYGSMNNVVNQALNWGKFSGQVNAHRARHSP